MDLTQLKIFQAVAEEGSVSRAAIRLHRVPSNISTRLRQLEEELGTDLFTREKLRLRLSPRGDIFLDYTQRILQLLEEARQATVDATPGGRFALGALESTAAVRIPPLLARYHHLYPQVDLEFSTGSTDVLVGRLLSGKLMAAFIDGPVTDPQLEGLPLWQEEMLVVAEKNHPPIACAGDAAGAPLYAFSTACAYRRLLENWFQAGNTPHGKVHEMESYHGMLACVSSGAGVALIPRSMLEMMPGTSAVSAWPLQGTFARVPTWLVWRRGAQSANLEVLRAMVQVD